MNISFTPKFSRRKYLKQSFITIHQCDNDYYFFNRRFNNLLKDDPKFSKPVPFFVLINSLKEKILILLNEFADKKIPKGARDLKRATIRLLVTSLNQLDLLKYDIAHRVPFTVGENFAYVIRYALKDYIRTYNNFSKKYKLKNSDLTANDFSFFKQLLD